MAGRGSNIRKTGRESGPSSCFPTCCLSTLALVTQPVGRYLAALAALVAALAAIPLLGAVTSASVPGAAAGAAVLLAVGAGVCLARLAALLRAKDRNAVELVAETDRLKALVAASPDPWFAWTADGASASSPTFAALLGLSEVRRLDDVETALAPSDAAALHGSFNHLRETHRPFLITVRTADGTRTLQAAGGHGPSPSADTAAAGSGPVHVLWLRDVTPAADAERRLREALADLEEQRDRFRAGLEALPVPIWLRRADLSLLWCNSAFAALAEATPEDVVRDQIELPGTALGEPPKTLALRAQAAGEAKSDNRWVVVEGDRRWLEITEAPLPGGHLLLGHGLDRTRLQETESELARHIAAHGEVLEQLGSAIGIFGSDTRLRFFNKAYAHLWDLDEDWLAGEPTFAELLETLRERRKLMEHADFPRYKKQLLTRFNSQIEAEEELMHLPDGRTLRTLWVPHPLGGLMTVQEDVTHALALESSYNTLIAVQQETLDNLAEGVAVFGSDGRLKLHNPAFERLWKVTSADLAGEPHALKVADALRELLDTGRDWESRRNLVVRAVLERVARNIRLERRDGSIMQVAQVPLPDGAVLVSFLDVTDSVRVEKALRASNEALATADRLKSEFIANVSYQLRTPLNAIMGFAEILNNQYFGELNPRQLEYARGVLEASRRLLSLVNDILDLATIQAGFMVLERKEVDVLGLLNAVALLTRDWVRNQSLTLKIDAPDDIGRIEGDEKRLKQALFNLVSNAVKFTPPGGTVTLSARRDGSATVLSVSDTGIGIPSADQERVFGRFERASMPNRQTGAGLGLSLVKSFVELHGGTVVIDSKPDEGTKVECRLPSRPTADAAKETRTAAL